MAAARQKSIDESDVLEAIDSEGSDFEVVSGDESEDEAVIGDLSEARSENESGKRFFNVLKLFLDFDF